MVSFFLPTIDGIASALSLTLAALASLRAASRLERRIGGGSIGLMDGPPILGPPPPRVPSTRRRRDGKPPNDDIATRDDGAMRPLDDGDGDDDGGGNIERDEDGEGGGCDGGISSAEASPLWEHTEAFRRAAILGLIFDEYHHDEDDHRHAASPPSDGIAAALFTDVVVVGRGCGSGGGRGGGGVGSGGDTAIAAAVEAGLGMLMPGGGDDGSAAAARHRVRGGGGGWGGRTRGGGGGGGNGGGRTANVEVDDGSGGGFFGFSRGNPIVAVASWFARELSAPFAALPAWHGLLRSYLRERRDVELRKSQWCLLLTPWERMRLLITGRCDGGGGGGGASGGGAYCDPSDMDFDSSVCAKARIPRVSSSSGGASPAGVDDDDDDDDDDDAMPAAARDAKSVRVRAFAPRAFRDLRNKCFRVNEGEYAESILNAMSEAASSCPNEMFARNDGEGIMLSFDDEGCDGQLAPGVDSAISRVVREILADGGGQQGGDEMIRRTSVRTTLPYISFQSNSKGAARAGTFFFFTADGAYMIKTVKNEEARAFLGMLPEYHRFMSEGVNGRNSLLTRIFGMYSVRFPSSDDDDGVRLAEDVGDRWDGGLFSSSHERASSSITDDERVYLVMHSVFPPEASSFVTERFDLKGSTVGRECSREERRSRGGNAVLKDLDLKREVEEELSIGADAAGGGGHDRKRTPRYGICVGRRSKTALMAQLERDVDLLCRCNVLDYSLLVGVADMDGVVRKTASSGRVPACIHNFFRWMDSPMPYFGAGTTKVDGGALSSLRGTRRGRHVMYYLGVIDFLQPWTVKKRLERDLKGLAGYDKSGISCVAPSDYAARFLKFINFHVT